MHCKPRAMSRAHIHKTLFQPGEEVETERQQLEEALSGNTHLCVSSLGWDGQPMGNTYMYPRSLPYPIT